MMVSLNTSVKIWVWFPDYMENFSKSVFDFPFAKFEATQRTIP